MRASAAETRSELAERTRFVLNLEDEIKELQQRLGATGADRDRLMMTLQAQERVREQFAQVESLFEPGEARILREGGRLIIRLTGIGFPSGSAQVPQNAQPLLGRLSRAISVFPGARLLVEGHTDATGSDQINQRLSEERARAVADWLVGELRLAPGQVPAAGYGASRPVANNATEAGRAQNRRIDVIITPDLPAGLP
ncbi:MAG: OmpA family protein [Chromatiales bacterium]|nr:OmpA family protein [Chromatiales bacterium]